MKKLKIAICAMLVLFGGLIFSACEEVEIKTFDANLIKTTKTETVYDGNSHLFEVEYKDVELDVLYSVDKVIYKEAEDFNLTNAGTYDLYYKISAEGYETYSSTEAVQLKITPKKATIRVGDTIICKSDAVTEISPEYRVRGLVGDDKIEVNFGIGKNVNTGAEYDVQTAVCGEKYKYDITWTENSNYNIIVDPMVGNILVKDYVGIRSNGVEQYVASIEEAYEVMEENSIIILYKDFVSTDGSYLGDLSLIASSKDYKFILDLNGHKIERELDFINYINPTTNYPYGIDVTIIDSSDEKSGVIGSKSEDLWYGILIKGDSKISVTLLGITAVGNQGGIYTNGYCKGVNVNAIDCTFVGTEGFVSAGAYFAGRGEYIMNNCSFFGDTAYYTKSGTHNLSNCEFYATAEYSDPSFNGNGCDVTGSALVVDSAQGYSHPINVTIEGGLFNSAHAYCIEEFSTAPQNADKILDASVQISGNVIYESFNVEAISSENDNVTIIK